MNATVRRTSSVYQGSAAFTVENPEDQKYVPGKAVLVLPAHEEAPAWRAILAGFDTEDRAILVPLQGHFGELRLAKVHGKPGNGLAHGTLDEPSSRDEVPFEDARILALSAALTFSLEGRA